MCQCYIAQSAIGPGTGCVFTVDLPRGPMAVAELRYGFASGSASTICVRVACARLHSASQPHRSYSDLH